ncbi:hypothetical protein HYX13_05880 [Candidatus Woesearchaeota archaeon]|nr:hypothetical protein [Candidatus Woesearchaeota archaeon]
MNPEQKRKSEQKKKFKKLLQHYGVPLSVLALTMVILLFFSFAFHYPTVGGAITVPPEDALDLVHNASLSIDVSKVNQWEFTADTSEREATNYQMNVILSEGKLHYLLQYRGERIASGLLGKEVPSTQGIFVDDDSVADIEFLFNPDNQVFTLSNLRYVAPEAATIRLLKSLDGMVVEDVAVLPINKEAQFQIEVIGASSSPTLTASFDDTTMVFQLQELSKTPTSRKYTLKFTPAAEKPYQLKLNAIVGGQTTTKNYLFGGNGVVYVLNDPQYPVMELTLLDDVTKNVKVKYVFPVVGNKQPFSLPCKGQKEASLFGNNSTLFSYDARKPLQWKENLPSDFTVIESFKGYLVRLSDANSHVSPRPSHLQVTMNCILSSELPSLKSGWNLVSITGFASKPVGDLSSSVPPGAQVRQVREMQRDEISQQTTMLVPGKVYWALVE